MNKIITEIRELEFLNDPDALGAYLTDLAKHGKCPVQFEDEFKKHLFSNDWYLKKTAIFCLLFALKIDKPEYRERAINFIIDLNEDDEVRRWSISGLGQTYENTEDKELIELFLSKIDDKSEDESLKSTFVSSILNIWGVSSQEQLIRTGKINNSADSLMGSFEKEFEIIRSQIK